MQSVETLLSLHQYMIPAPLHNEKKTIFYFINKAQWFLLPALIWFIVAPFFLCYYRDGAIYRFINEHYSTFADMINPFMSDIGTGGFAVFVLLLLMLYRPFCNFHYFLCALLCNGVPALVTQLFKNIYQEPRPLSYLNEASWIHHIHGQPHLYNLSFPSGHTTSAFALFTFFTMLLPARLKGIGFIFFMIAISVGYSRIYLSHHFFTDVYAGSLIGTFFSVLLFWILNRRKSSFNLS